MKWVFKLLSPKNHFLFPSLSCAFKLILGISVFGWGLGVCSASQHSKVPGHKICSSPENAPWAPHSFKAGQPPSNWVQSQVVTQSLGKERAHGGHQRTSHTPRSRTQESCLTGPLVSPQAPGLLSAEVSAPRRSTAVSASSAPEPGDKVQSLQNTDIQRSSVAVSDKLCGDQARASRTHSSALQTQCGRAPGSLPLLSPLAGS